METKIKKEISGIQESIELAPYTTFKIGGPAKFFFTAKTKEDLIKAIKTAKEFKLPFFLLAGGSNLLVSDKGYEGLVIKFQNSNFRVQDSEVIAEAGMALSELIDVLTKLELSGLEWVAGIPGTVGGAVRGNAGAFGKSMADMIKIVEVLETDSKLQVRNYRLKDCEFNYRDSIFKRDKSLIILSAEIKLGKGNQEKIKKDNKRYLDYRKEKHPLKFPSAGSIFKNPEGFSAGKLIEKCNLKGEKKGQAQISEKHANFIINLGRAKAEEVLELINLAKQKVREKFGVELEEEIQFLGF